MSRNKSRRSFQARTFEQLEDRRVMDNSGLASNASNLLREFLSRSNGLGVAQAGLYANQPASQSVPQLVQQQLPNLGNFNLNTPVVGPQLNFAAHQQVSASTLSADVRSWTQYVVQQNQSQAIGKVKSYIIQSNETNFAVMARNLTAAGALSVKGLGAVGSFEIRTDKDLQTVLSKAGLKNTQVYNNHEVRITGAQTNDPYASQQYAFDRILAQPAWSQTRGINTVVAVLDTGIDWTHPDLSHQVWINPKELIGNGIDDDGNGFVDDSSGYDFINRDQGPIDDQGHGTHVSGIIAAKAENALGIAGIAPHTRILPIKVLAANGSGSTSTVIEGLNYVIQLKKLGAPIDVINMSLGGGGYSAPFAQAIAEATALGIVVVASAGNSATNNDLTRAYPASYPGVLSVMATDGSDNKANFSNFGNSVTIAAPGNSIISTMPNSTYASLSGTSMAAPMVAATVALMKAANRQLTSAQIVSLLKSTADRIPGLAVETGRLNVQQAVTAAVRGVYVPAPAAPTNASTVVNDNQIQLRWSAVPNAVRYDTQILSGTTVVQMKSTSTPSVTFTSLGFDTRYTLQVRAVSSTGVAGAWTTVTARTKAATFPTMPSISNLTRNGAILSWKDSSGELGYRVSISTNGKQWTYLGRTAANVTSYQLRNLARGTTYYVRVSSVLANQSDSKFAQTSFRTPL